MLWTSQTISELGSRVSMFVFPLLVWQTTHSTLLAAAVEALHLLGRAGALLPAGVLADRFDRLRIMRYASGWGALLYASLVAAGVTGRLTTPHLALVALLSGVGAGLFGPAETAAVRSLVPDKDLATALSQLQARQHVASLVGAPVGGALYTAARWLPFAADSVSFAVSWALLGRIRTDLSAPPGRSRNQPGVSDIREGIGFAMSRPLFRTLLTWSALVNLTVNALVFVALMRLIGAGFHPAAIGLVETAAGVAGVLGAVTAPRIVRRFATGQLTVVIAWSFVPLVVPMVLWNHPAAVAASLAAGLFLNPAGNAGIGAYRMAATPDRLQGRMASASQFLAVSTMPLAPVVGGGLLAWLGGSSAIAVLGVLTGLAALVVTLSRTVREVPRPDKWQAHLDQAAGDLASPRTGADQPAVPAHVS